LREWTLESGNITRDYRSFDAIYEQAAAEPAATVAPQPSAATMAAEKLRLIKPAPPENAAAAAPVVAAAPTAAAAARAPAAPAPVTVAAPVAVAAPLAVAAPAPMAAKAAVAAPARAAASVAAPAAAAAAVSDAAPAAASAAAAPTAAGTRSRLVSIQTGSLDELSRLPGLGLGIAKEIVKSRPYTSVDALVDVRGVGEKTLRRIKRLIKL